MLGEITTVVVCAGIVLICFGLGTQLARDGKRGTGVMLTLLVAGVVYGITESDMVRGASILGLIAGCVQALGASKKIIPFEQILCITSDPDVANWPNLFCSPCSIQTKAKRTYPPESPPACPRCGKPLQG